MSSLIKFLKELAQWFLDALVWVFEKIWETILGALAAIIEAIPVPAWLSGADPFAGIDPGVAYVLEAFMLVEGIAILLSALLIRFTIRRLPIVG